MIMAVEAAKRMRQTHAVTGDRWFQIAAECLERQHAAIALAVEAIERGSTSAPVLEALKATLDADT